jgi:hypothetical protein
MHVGKIFKNQQNQFGAVPQLVTFIGIGLIIAGIFVGRQLVEMGGRYLPKAASIPCPLIRCDRLCPDGEFVIDEKGCQTCECATDDIDDTIMPKYSFELPPGPYNPGDTISVKINIDTQLSVLNTAVIYVIFDKNYLQYISTSNGNFFDNVSSAYDNDRQLTLKGITNLPAGKSGIGIFANISFKVNAISPGSSEIIAISYKPILPSPTIQSGSCWESDGGNNPEVGGYATIGGSSSRHVDSCSHYTDTGKYILYETVCENGSIATKSHTCSEPCYQSNGYSGCKVNSQTTPTISPTPYCKDSDTTPDKWNSESQYYTPGQLCITQPGAGTGCVRDHCRLGQLVEHRCNGSKQDSIIVNCACIDNVTGGDGQVGAICSGSTITPPPVGTNPGLTFSVMVPDMSGQNNIPQSDVSVEVYDPDSVSNTPIDSVQVGLYGTSTTRYSTSQSVFFSKVTQSKKYNIVVKIKSTISRVFRDVILTSGKIRECANLAGTQGIVTDCGDFNNYLLGSKQLVGGDSDGFNKTSGSYNKVDIADYQKYTDENTGVVTTKMSDFNGDGQINTIDLGILARRYGFSGDGTITIIPSLTPHTEPPPP